MVAKATHIFLSLWERRLISSNDQPGYALVSCTQSENNSV